MSQLYRFKLVFISTALLMTLINGCQLKATPTRPAEEPESPRVDIKVVPSGEPLVRMVQTENIPQPNCGGTLEVENVVQRSRTIIHTVELGGSVEVNARGEAGLLGTGVQVGAAIAAQYGQSYGTEDTLTRAVTVKAKEGTNMEHTIRQVEIWQPGTVEIAIGDQKFTYPYHFRNDFGVELVKSRNIGCPPIPMTEATGKPTLPPESTMPPGERPEPTTAVQQPTPVPAFVEVIRVPGYAENGFTFNCGTSGRYFITIMGGAYSGWPSDDSPGYNGWRTRIHIYKNRPVEWGSRVGFIEPVNPDYSIGQWEKPSRNEAEFGAVGMNIPIDLQSGDYLIFMPIDEQASYSDNRGEVVLKIELISSP